MTDDQMKALQGKTSEETTNNMCKALTKLKNAEFAEKKIPEVDYNKEQFNQENQ